LAKKQEGVLMVAAVFERFVQESPIAVMVRATLENAFSAPALDQLFAQTAQQQYTRTLLFSTVVDLMTTVVLRQEKSLHAAFQQRRAQLAVGISSLYEKLARLETGVSEALVTHSVARVAPVLRELEPCATEVLPGYEVRIVDGHHLEGTEHRLKPLRRTRAGALPGQSLVALDPQRKLIRHVRCCEDGHAQERALVDEALAWVEPEQVWVADRNFATTRWIFGVHRRRGYVVVREHASTLHWVAKGPTRTAGRCETGSLSEQEIQVADEHGGELRLRRITLRLDRPTRDGDRVIVVLTTLPETVSAAAIAELYRTRWRIEGAFQELTVTLQCEPNTLGYPPAALFAFCLAVMAYNVLRLTRAALGAAHGPEKIEREVSSYYLAQELAKVFTGLAIALPPEEWQVYASMTPAELAAQLWQWAQQAPLWRYQKHPRGPNKPRPQRLSGAKISHVATARLLANMTRG
jgi:IS4 transposase